MKYFLTLPLFLITNCLIAQIDQLGDIFIGKQPIWSHVSIDSTAIGYKGRTGMDYLATLAERKILVNDNYIYQINDNIFEKLSGGFIEKINLKTGKSIWKNYFDLRNSSKREYTNHFFINSHNQLELLNFRYSYDTVDIFSPSWDNGKLTVRKYDLTSGEEMYIYHSPINDPNYPLFKASRNVYSYLNKNSVNGYDCYTNYIDKRIPSFGMARTRMDSLGKLINIDASNDIYGIYKNINPFEDVPYLLNEQFDTIIRLIHTYSRKPYITGDTMEFSLYFMDKNLTLLNNPNLADKISNIREYQMVSLKNEHICILGTEYFEDNSFPRQHIFVFGSNGNLLEEIVYPARINNSFGTCIGLLKLKNEPGILLLNKYSKNLDSINLSFYKSDGKGNLSFLAEIKMKDYYNLAIEGYLEELEDGKIILSGLFRQANLDVSQLPKTERFITSLWDLGITTSNKSINEYQSEIKLQPNPTQGSFKIDGIKFESQNYFITVHNVNGELILSKSATQNSDLILSLTGFATGTYYLSIYDANNLQIFLGQIIKLGN